MKNRNAEQGCILTTCSAAKRAIELDSAIEVTVYLYIAINTDGSINDATVPRGVTSSLNREAIRVVQSMPKWKQGKKRCSSSEDILSSAHQL
ncbi:MAG: energy transducer TonB [Mangrovibacterium sp.]